jgi:hypothetical protein
MANVCENSNSEWERALTVAVVALPLQLNWLHVPFIIIIIITCYLGLLLIKHEPREHGIGLEPYICGTGAEGGNEN